MKNHKNHKIVNNRIKVYIGADHGGYKLKEKIKKWLGEWGYKYEDCGAFKLDPKDDYPDFALAVARKVARPYDDLINSSSAKPARYPFSGTLASTDDDVHSQPRQSPVQANVASKNVPVADSRHTLSPEILSHERSFESVGILACRSGAGMVIAANKVRGVRAGAAFDIRSAKHMREHNDANILAVSGDWLDERQAKGIIKVFLETKFSMEERHIRRIEKVAELENRD
jgi:RpiB/LacA/LacB family sugar-phosphate isomerase